MRPIPPDLARDALDAAPDAMLIMDAAGTICYVNRQVSALFGYPAEELVDRPIEVLMPERFRKGHVARRDAYVGALRPRPLGAGLQLYGRRQDGSEFPVEISLSPIRDPDRTLVAAAIRDVTARRRAEAELLDARRLAEEAREAADRANLAKSRFLATASHDLRQPLQTLALLNGTLRRLLHGEELLEANAQQEQAIGAMSRLLNALLDISKLESGTITPFETDFAVRDLLAALDREYGRLAAEKGLELRIDAEVSVAHSDPALVEQVLRNLLSNAIKYTARGTVSVQSRRAGSSIRIQVQDSGVGIPADKLPFIFDEFYQVNVAGNAHRDGYGLGLNIVQRIVRLLDLQLAVESEVDAGSVFTLTLPAAESDRAIAKAELPAAPMAGPTAPSQHVLLVEDDPAVRNATRMLLSVEGYRVTAVGSIAEAVACARVESLDLLITDYHLAHGETGTALIAAVRKIAGAALKVILVTGDTSAAVTAQPPDASLRVASKPIRADALLRLMRGP